MISSATLRQKFDGWMNPVALKELRQAVQGRFVTSVLLLFLIVSVAALGITLLTGSGELEDDMSGGMRVFGMLFVILMLTCLIFIPINTAMRLDQEWSKQQVDLLFVTTLPPWRIVWGKFLASAILALLMYAACMPFMTLTYLMRGIDLPTIFSMLGLGYVIVLVAIMMAICAACVPVHKALKILLAMFAVFALISTSGGVMSLLTFGLIGGMPLGGMGSPGTVWAITGTFLGMALLGMGLLFILSTTLITPSTANRAMPIRLYMMFLWLTTGLVFYLWGRYNGDYEIMIGWFTLMMGLLLFFWLGSISERDGLGPRVRRLIPRNPTGRIPLFFLFSGAGGGVLWCVAMMAATFAVGWWFGDIERTGGRYLYGDKDGEFWYFYILNITLYVFAYGMAAVLIGQLSFKLLGARVRCGFTWAVTMVLMMLCVLIPMLVAFFSKVNLEREAAFVWNLGNPFAFYFYDGSKEKFLLFSGIWVGIMTVCNLPWLAGQIRNFQPLENTAPLPIVNGLEHQVTARS